MADLQSKPLIELNLDTREIAIINTIKYYDIDKNVANIFLQIYKTDDAGFKIYLNQEELDAYTAEIFLVKPNTLGFVKVKGVKDIYFEAENGGGILKFKIPAEYTNRNGVVKCEIHISRGNELLSSDRFVYSVHQSLVTEFEDSLLEDSDFPVLQQLIKDVQKANNINDENPSETLTYSSSKIDSLISESKKPKYDMPIKGNVFGHRGINDFAPENTLVGIQTAYRYGYKSIELDIHRTSDNEWILMHDQTVDRTTNGSGNVSSLTLAQIQALEVDAGSNLAKFNQAKLRVPTLKQALQECKKLNMTAMLDVKASLSDTQAVDLINLIKNEGCLDRVIFSCYLSPSKLRAIRKADKAVWLDYTPTTFDDEAIRVMKEVYPCTFDIDGTTVNSSVASQVALAQKNDIIVLAWTVDNVDRIKYLISLGVKSVITNRAFVGGDE